MLHSFRFSARASEVLTNNFTTPAGEHRPGEHVPGEHRPRRTPSPENTAPENTAHGEYRPRRTPPTENTAHGEHRPTEHRPRRTPSTENINIIIVMLLISIVNITNAQNGTNAATENWPSQSTPTYNNILVTPCTETASTTNLCTTTPSGFAHTQLSTTINTTIGVKLWATCYYGDNSGSDNLSFNNWRCKQYLRLFQYCLLSYH